VVEGATLLIQGESFAGASLLEDESVLAHLAFGSTKESMEIDAIVKGPSFADVVPLPPSALLTGQSGGQCVINADNRPVPVEVTGGTSGRTYVTGIGRQPVVANPASSLGITRCP